MKFENHFIKVKKIRDMILLLPLLPFGNPVFCVGKTISAL